MPNEGAVFVLFGGVEFEEFVAPGAAGGDFVCGFGCESFPGDLLGAVGFDDEVTGDVAETEVHGHGEDVANM